MEKSHVPRVIAWIIPVPGLRCWETSSSEADVAGVVGAFLAFSRVWRTSGLRVIWKNPCPPYYSTMASCSHSPTTDAPSPFPAPPCCNKLNNYMFAEAPLLPSRLLSSHSLPTLFSSQLYNPHIFWTALDPIRYIDINPILHVRKLRIRHVLRNLHKVTCQL